MPIRKTRLQYKIYLLHSMYRRAAWSSSHFRLLISFFLLSLNGPLILFANANLMLASHSTLAHLSFFTILGSSLVTDFLIHPLRSSGTFEDKAYEHKPLWLMVAAADSSSVTPSNDSALPHFSVTLQSCLILLHFLRVNCCVAGEEGKGAKDALGQVFASDSKDGTDALLNDPRTQKLIEALEYKYNENGRQQNVRKALQLLQEISPGTDSIAAQALYELGDFYLHGTQGFRGIRRDIKKAVAFFNQSALCGFGPALHMTSVSLSTGIGNLLPPNEKTAAKLEYLAAMTNYVPAIMGMGFRFMYGHGVRKSCELAMKHYKFAAEVALRSEDSSHRYPLGDGDRLNEKTMDIAAQAQQMQSQQTEILQYWEHQAKGGDPMAQYELAKMREEDPTKINEVTKLYKQAANGGLPNALRDLGAAYLQGSGVERDVSKGMDYLLQAADLEDAESLNLLGYIFMFGDENTFGIQQNLTTSYNYFKKAAMQDYPESLFFLGEFQIKSYSNDSSNVTDEDYRLALRYFERAADHGYIQAFWRTAQFYEVGKGVPRSCEAATYAYKIVAESSPWVEDARKGLKYFIQRDFEGALLVNSLFAEEGYEVAQSNAAWLYRNSKGCTGKQCVSKALRLLFLSHLQGNPESLYGIADIYLHGRGDIPKDIPTAVNSLKRALKKGDLRALTLLASLYEQGAGNLPRDFDKAETLLVYALEQLRKSEGNTANTGLKPSLKENVMKLSKISSVVAQLAKIRLKRRLTRRSSN
ncbi:Sel1 repeat-containing protein [Cardiosporidium cionae]|uniref:Sel1 repeat-containing protein n=1 Tax=Cardiosporidium cionae TaxID=476202 RepID=A0ABQ7JDR1_9APIC|nr:Sel1 repeat-containing protein [Cardiosporidium cionae]|eukprot:KAF8822014.1 Sel1 repeat-containing protein [Cardiosporidium cionae]